MKEKHLKRLREAKLKFLARMQRARFPSVFAPLTQPMYCRSNNRLFVHAFERDSLVDLSLDPKLVFPKATTQTHGQRKKRNLCVCSTGMY